MHNSLPNATGVSSFLIYLLNPPVCHAKVLEEINLQRKGKKGQDEIKYII